MVDEHAYFSCIARICGDIEARSITLYRNVPKSMNFEKCIVLIVLEEMEDWYLSEEFFVLSNTSHPRSVVAIGTQNQQTDEVNACIYCVFIASLEKNIFQTGFNVGHVSN